MRNTIFFFIFICTSIHAQQGKLKRANRFYEQLSYAYAIDIYKKIEKSDSANIDVIGKMAFCYYQLGNMTKSELYFEKLVMMGSPTRDQLFYYAQSLKQNGKYAESDAWMKKITFEGQNDLRSKSIQENPGYLAKINSQPAFFIIRNLPINSKSSDFGACETKDGTRVYFVTGRHSRRSIRMLWSWNKKEFLDLFTYNKSNIDKQKPSKRKVNTNFHEGPLCFSADGNWVYFTRNNTIRGSNGKDSQGIRNFSLYRARLSKNGAWKKIELLEINNKEYSIGHPSLSPDGKTLYFASDMPGGFGGSDLYKVDIFANGNFGTPINLGPKINTEGNEMFPHISIDGKLYFSSNGLIGLGGLDVFVVSSDLLKSTTPMNVGRPINSQKDDFAFCFNSDNRTGYFSSNRDGGEGDDDIYALEQIKEIEFKNRIVGHILANENGQSLNGIEIFLKDENGQVVATSFSDADGSYFFDVIPEKTYTISIQAKEYLSQQKENIGLKIGGGQSEIMVDFNLDKNPKYVLACYVTDSKKHLPVKDVKLIITDKNTGKVLDMVDSLQNARFLTNLNDYLPNQTLNLTIQIEKPGYFKKNVSYSYVLTNNNIINLHESIDLELDRIELGVDLATVIDINPIYFDLGKSNIRKDAALELDKIAKLMNEYPNMRIELGSHTDCRSSYAFNEKLSSNRALASANYIKARISNPSRIYGKGYGEKKLKINCPCEGTVVSTCSEAEHQANRRTEFIIIKL